MSCGRSGKIELVIFPMLLLAISVPFCAHAYDADTHAYLTEEALSFYASQAADGGMPSGMKSFTVDGARREDDAPRWMDHFYDPVNDRGLTYDPAIDPGIYVGAWESSKDWANDAGNQGSLTYKVPATVASILTAIEQQKLSGISSDTDFTWGQAKQYYLEGQYEKAFFALGHILHLVQDASVPDHTRNDPHPGDSPYENYTKQFTLANPDKELDAKLKGNSLVAFSSLGEYFDSLAIYSNNNFYSKDTIGIQSGYKLPEIDHFEVLGDGRSYGIAIDKEFGDYPLVKSKSLLAVKNDDLLDRPLVMAAYWSRLSTNAVQYGAGVIDLFFHEVQKDKESGAVASAGPKSFFATIVGFVDAGANGLAQMIRGVFAPSADADVSQNGPVPPAESGSGNVPVSQDTSAVPGDAQVDQAGQEEDDTSEYPDEDIDVFRYEDDVAVASTSVGNDAAVVATSSLKKAAIATSSVKSAASATKEAVSWAFAVKIDEIMYDAPGSDSGKEWIEVVNRESVPVDICDWRLSTNGTNHKLSFSRGACEISPGGYAIIATSDDGFEALYPWFSGTVITGSFSLNNSGGTISLKNGDVEIDSVTYSSDAGAHGDGNSLQLFGDAWYSRTPTPGTENVFSGGGGGGVVAQNTQGIQNASSNHAPVAAFTAMPFAPQVGEAVLFDASASRDADGVIARYSWDFGDGESASGTQSGAEHAYATSGSYTVRLSVEDDGGSTGEIERAIQVAPADTTPAIPADHVVMSEILFDAAGSDTGKEFIELYNPTAVPVNMDGWAFRYASGDATTTVSLAILDGAAGDHTEISSGGFLLVGFSNYDAANFGGRTADAVRAHGLPNGTAESTQVVLRDGEGGEIDRVIYASTSIGAAGQSIERKTVRNGMCVSPQSTNEFEGNSCDRGSVSDFTVRAAPNPQNSESLIEPRGSIAAPVPISGAVNVATFDKASMTFDFAWRASTSSDPRAVVSYKIADVSTDGILVDDTVTTSTGARVRVREVGKEYAFSMTASDQEGLTSSSSLYRIAVPSLLANAYAYPDPRETGERHYLFDLYYDTFPFIPDEFGQGAWQGIVVYEDRTPNPVNEVLLTENAYVPDDTSSVVNVAYPSCLTGVAGSSVPSLTIPLGDEWCEGGGGLASSALDFKRLEDDHLLVRSASTTDAFAQSGYFTLAYYTLKDSGGGRQDLALVALDRTRYPFQPAPPSQNAPHMRMISTSYDPAGGKLLVSWEAATDLDSIDDDLVYELNFTPTSESNVPADDLWTASTTALSYERTVVPNERLLIGVRARDDFGNVSNVATTTWSAPSAGLPIVQAVETGWSDEWGTVLHSSAEPDTASFQSLVPQGNASFDTVIVKTWQSMVSDTATLRMAVYADNGSGRPDMSRSLGEATLSNVLDPDKEREHAFTFASPIAVEAGSTYWLALDVAGYSDPTGYTRNAWRNAVAAGGDAYAAGVAGTGKARGANDACPDGCGYERPYWTVGPADWYFKLGASG